MYRKRIDLSLLQKAQKSTYTREAHTYKNVDYPRMPYTLQISLSTSGFPSRYTVDEL